MEDVLHAMYGDRTFLARDVEDALDPQQVLAAIARQRSHPQAERFPVDRLIEGQAGCADTVIVPVHVLLGVVMIMIVAVMIMIVAMVVIMILIGFGAQPV